MGRSKAAVLVFLLALAARVVLLLALGVSEAPRDDERGYVAVAGSLARGDGFSMEIDGISLDGEPVRRRLYAFRAPLYPMVLAPAHWVSGGSPAVLRLWSCLLGALAAPLALTLAARARAPAAAAVAAGVVVALWPSHAWLSTRLLSEPLDSVLLLAAADFALRRRFLHLGGTLGLALLCRPGGLAAALLLVPVAARRARHGSRFRAAALCGVAMAAVVGPWLLRNAVVLGAPVSVTSAGVTLAGGNCDAALRAEYPGKWVPPERSWTGPGRPDLGMYGWSALDEVASDRRFSDEAMAWADAHPADAVRLAGWKVVRFLDPDTRSEKSDAARKAWLGWISWGPALVLLALALVSPILRGTPPWLVALALLGGHLLSAVVAYGDARARAPVEPVLLALLVVPLCLAGPRATSNAAPDPRAPIQGL